MSRKKFSADDARRQVMELLDRLCAPPVPKCDYLDVLEQVRDDCEIRSDAVRAEIEEDEEEGAQP